MYLLTCGFVVVSLPTDGNEQVLGDLWCLHIAPTDEAVNSVTVKAHRSVMVPHLPPRFGHKVRPRFARSGWYVRENMCGQ